MTESYFQTKSREELDREREWFEKAQANISNNPEFSRNEERSPGQVADYMDEAANYLDEAESIIPALVPGPQQKSLWVAFLKTLDLAHRSIYRALRDPSISRDDVRQAATKKPRRPEINDWIKRQLLRQPDAKSPDLWNRAPDWITDQDHFDQAIKFAAFARRVTTVRGELGLKRNKTTSSN